MSFPIRQSLLVAVLTASFAATGCGQVPGLPGAALRGGDGFGALADTPEIGAQIAASKIRQDENGIQVKKLPVPSKAKPVTFLTYKALDNNLGSVLPMHLNALEKAGSNQNVNALVLADDVGPGNTRRWYITQDKDANAITSPWVKAGRGGEMNTGDANSLASVMKWGFGTYPSQVRWLDINNHGGGYYGIAQDDNADKIIRLPELAAGLKKGNRGKKLDLLTFDACLMATAEVAYEVRDTAKVMVGSEDSSYALGMNYDATLNALAQKPSTDPAELGRDLVLRSARKGKTIALYTISAIDLSKAANVAGAVDQLGKSLMKALPRNAAAIKQSLNATKAFYVAGPDKSDFNHRDLNEVVDQLRQRVQDPAVQAACQAVKGTLFNKGGAIIMSRSANEEAKVARGLSIYLPTDGQVDAIYKDTAFAKATSWDEFLAALK